jgi:polyisoprenoid-binding protein YceI
VTTTPETTFAHDLSAGRSWRLDSARSQAEFRVPHFWGLATVKGHFKHLDGWLHVGHDGRCEIELDLDAASLDTGNRKRDEHLRSPEFFDIDRHPTVSFRSTSAIDIGNGRLHVAGRLEAAGESAPLVLEAAFQQGDHGLEIAAATTVDQRRLGMTWSPLGMAKTPVALALHARLQESRST